MNFFSHMTLQCLRNDEERDVSGGQGAESQGERAEEGGGKTQEGGEEEETEGETD